MVLESKEIILFAIQYNVPATVYKIYIINGSLIKLKIVKILKFQIQKLVLPFRYDVRAIKVHLINEFIFYRIS